MIHEQGAFPFKLWKFMHVAPPSVLLVRKSFELFQRQSGYSEYRQRSNWSNGNHLSFCAFKLIWLADNINKTLYILLNFTVYSGKALNQTFTNKLDRHTWRKISVVHCVAFQIMCIMHVLHSLILREIGVTFKVTLAYRLFSNSVLLKRELKPNLIKLTGAIWDML